MKCYYRRGFLRKLVNHEGTVKDFQRTCNINDVVFKVVCTWNSMKTKTVRQAGGKLWLAVMTADGASDEEDFAGFYVRNKETFHEIVSMFVKLEPTNPEFSLYITNLMH